MEQFQSSTAQHQEETILLEKVPLLGKGEQGEWPAWLVFGGTPGRTHLISPHPETGKAETYRDR